MTAAKRSVGGGGAVGGDGGEAAGDGGGPAFVSPRLNIEVVTEKNP
ncbi:hypothetical protein ACFQMF_10670 [Halorubrum rutilum]|uniref:Uncharacterized protein n=1 Tax=Halorubrum rutilum TaxID=1364933 RepID=A0ABD6AL85_9EURY|nr:hypothetical protein [Halorubrum rutilum]